jgi:bacteriocin-like protein
MEEKQKLSDDMLNNVSGGFSDSTTAVAKDTIAFIYKLVTRRQRDPWSKSEKQEDV